jgi:hypothetical protein
MAPQEYDDSVQEGSRGDPLPGRIGEPADHPRLQHIEQQTGGVDAPGRHTFG